MENNGIAVDPQWRRFTVDALIGASVFVLALGGWAAAAGNGYMLLILGSIVLLGIGLIVEPVVVAQPAGDNGSQSSQPPSEPSRRTLASGPWADALDAAIVSAIGSVPMPAHLIR